MTRLPFYEELRSRSVLDLEYEHPACFRAAFWGERFLFVGLSFRSSLLHRSRSGDGVTSSPSENLDNARTRLSRVAQRREIRLYACYSRPRFFLEDADFSAGKIRPFDHAILQKKGKTNKSLDTRADSVCRCESRSSRGFRLEANQMIARSYSSHRESGPIRAHTWRAKHGSLRCCRVRCVTRVSCTQNQWKKLNPVTPPGEPRRAEALPNTFL